jgi:hypothetical protein
LLTVLIPFGAVALVVELWIHTAFGINAPWETPDFFHVCGREYRLGGEERDPRTVYTLTVNPTIFDLPIPMPDAAPIEGSLGWGGCPVQVVLERADGDHVVYAFIQGGP